MNSVYHHGTINLMRTLLKPCLFLLFLSSIVGLWSIPIPSIAQSAVDEAKGSITIALTQEPPNLDTTRTTDLVSFFVLGHVGEGLVRYDRRGNLSPGVAESWEVSDERLIFKLRPDAKWSDGSQVTAHDFAYAFRLMNDPAYAAPYAAIYYPLKNAEAIQKGEMPVSALGVQTPDPETLVVELESPCGYCVGLMVHAAFYPIKESFRREHEKTYGAEVEDLLYNGPFMLTEWVHGARLKMVKNPLYWNHKAIRLNEINVGYITEDNRTRLNLFRDERIALARLGAETVKDAAAKRMRLRTFLTGGVAYLRFNVDSERLLSDLRVRRAIQLVFDPNEFVNKIIAIPGYRPAVSFFPSWLKGVEGEFSEEYPLPAVQTDFKKARSLIAEVQAERGELPPLTLLTVTSPTGAKIAEYFQGVLSQKLGLEVRVDQQIFKLYIDKSQRGEFDIAISSWYPDFDDVVTFADLLGSYNPNNRGNYSSQEYDSALSVLVRESDPVIRMEAADRLQKMIQSEVPVLPMAETGSAYLQHPRLKGVVRRVLGADPDYTFSYISAK